ncbi:MAG: alkaline phosphatase D family protein [Candidatus Rokubacteria bacterium]|nr:alkaline phosphatase D family protein [Candidatus Rokubacteria bacterium]
MAPGSRRVLTLLAAVLLVGAAPRARAAPQLLLTVGDVTATSAVVWARGVTDGELAVAATAPDGALAARSSVRVTRGDDFAGKVRLTGLRPATRYGVQVRSGGETARGEFTTAPPHDQPARVTFLWSGDLGGGGRCRLADGGYRIFRAMTPRRPDFFLFAGDTIYADVKCDKPGVLPGADFIATTLTGFRGRHRYNREDPAVQDFFKTTSVYAIWDDHEVRNNFSGPTEPLMVTGRRAFLEYWPVSPPDEEPTRLYRKFRWGRLLEVFILDTRQYRSPNTDPDGPAKTMLGAPQRRWLVDNVSTSTALWKVVVSSIPLSVPTGRPDQRDSWTGASVYGTPPEGGTGFATERDAILKALRDRGVKNLLVLAADVHHAEVIRHRPTPEWSFHEFIAGPLSAGPGRPRPLDEGLNPRSLWARGGVYNFGEIAIEPAHLTVRIVDDDGAVLYTHTLAPE